jgi:LCP family protein required for cell wall assembly
VQRYARRITVPFVPDPGSSSVIALHPPPAAASRAVPTASAYPARAYFEREPPPVVDLQPRPHSVLPPELDPRGPRRPKRSHEPGRRVVRLMALTLSVLVLIASVGGYAVIKWFDGSIARIHLNLGQDRPASAAKGSENWLLVGTDNSATNDYGDRAGMRSDTTILTHLDADGTTTNLSFPRDSLVTIPAYTATDGKVTPEHKDKFNSAIALGGPSLLVKTVEKLTGVRIDHYVAVDLDGFSDISKALNGVKVCILPSTYHDPTDPAITNINDGFSGFHGVVGEQTVAGEQALAFVRQRHGLPRGDIDRIARQQQFLGSVFRAATQVKLLFNPIAVAKLLDAIKNSLTLDQDTSLMDLEKLGMRLKGVDPSKVLFETVPQRGLQPTDTDLGHVFTDAQGGLEIIPNGQTDSVGNVQIIDQNGFQAMLAKVKDEKPPAPKASTSKAPATKKLTVAPSQILVNVQNGVGRQGLAGSVTTALKQEGFQTGLPAGAGSNAYSVSVVKYGAGQQDAARTVAAAVPGATLMADNTLTDGAITLIVGQNYSSVQPVAVGAAVPAQPAPTPSATATTPANTAASAGNRCTY